MVNRKTGTNDTCDPEIKETLQGKRNSRSDGSVFGRLGDNAVAAEYYHTEEATEKSWRRRQAAPT